MIKGMFGRKKSPLEEEELATMTQGAGILPQQAAPQQARPSFMDKGLDFAGGVADTLIQLRGGPATYSAVKQQRQQQQFREAQYERKRRDEFEDQMKMAQWERDNPKPGNNDTANDYTLMEERVKAGLMTPDQFKTWEENNILNPTWKQGWNGQWAQPGRSGGTYGAELPPGITLDGEGGATGNGGGNFPR